MKTLLSSLVLLALVGCGSNDSSSPNNPSGGSLAGTTWVNEISTNAALAIAFTSSTTWKADMVALLTDGSYGLQIDSGTYSISGSTLTLTKTASSCEGVSTATVTKTAADTYTRNGSSLTLLSGDGTHVAMFQLDNTPPTGMGIATIGCFDNNNNFITHAVTAVP